MRNSGHLCGLLICTAFLAACATTRMDGENPTSTPFESSIEISETVPAPSLTPTEPPTSTPVPTGTPTPIPTSTPVSLKIVPDWEPGESRIIEIIKRQNHTGGDKPISELTSRTLVDIQVLELKERSYVIEWVFGRTVFEDLTLSNDPFLAYVLEIMDGMRIEYEVDLDGEFIGLRNGEEFHDLLMQTVNSIAEKMAESGHGEQYIHTFRSLIEPRIQVEAELSEFLEEVQLYHMAFGLTLMEDRPIPFSSSLPNIIGGDPFPATGEFILSGYQPSTSSAIIQWSQSIDAEQARTIIMQHLTEMVIEFGAVPPVEDELEAALPDPFEIDDSGSITISSRKGWVNDIQCLRITHFGDMTLEESIHIKDVTDQIDERNHREVGNTEISPDDMAGIWTHNEELYFLFTRDGEFGVSSSALNVERSPFDWGHYSLEAGILTLESDTGSLACPGRKGQYRIAMPEDDILILELLSDECGRIIGTVEFTRAKE